MPVTREEMDGPDPLDEAMQAEGITPESLARQLKAELEATEERVFNDKGAMLYSKALPAHKVRQEARKDAHRLRGDYPAERKEITGSLSLEQVIKELEDDEG